MDIFYVNVIFSSQQLHAPQLLRLIFINSLFFFILAIFIFYIYLYPVCCNSSKTAATQHKSKRITFSYFLKLKRLGLHLRWKGIDSIQYMQRERAGGRGMGAKCERSGNCGCETWMRTKEKWFFLKPKMKRNLWRKYSFAQKNSRSSRRCIWICGEGAECEKNSILSHPGYSDFWVKLLVSTLFNGLADGV